MALDDNQRAFLDGQDNLSEQTLLARPQVVVLASRLYKWKAEGRDVTPHDLAEWARQRELADRIAAVLEGMALAVQLSDQPTVVAAVERAKSDSPH